MSYYSTRRRANDSPERQRKIALVTAALERRGLQPDYRGLRPTGDGTWTVGTRPLPGRPVVEPLADGWYDLQGDDFAGLLALVSDDLTLARWIYTQRDPEQARVRNALRVAEHALYNAGDDYGRACVRQAMAIFDGRADLTDLTAATGAAFERLTQARADEREAREVFDAYHAAVPTTQEEAAAYLAGLPTVVRD